MKIMKKIYDWYTGKGKLRSEIARENRGLAYSALALIACIGIMKGGEFYLEQQRQKRIELCMEAPDSVPVERVEGKADSPLEQRAYTNFVDTSNWQIFADNFDVAPEDEEAQHPVTPEFIDDIINKGERTTNPSAVSPKGARGLMQIMPETWNETTTKLYGKPLNYDLADNPETNRVVGTAYLQTIDNMLTNGLKEYSKMPIKGKQKYIAAAYNGGPSRLVRNNGDIARMPRETRNYVKRMFGSK